MLDCTATGQSEPDNIARWSRRCLQWEVTAEQFAADEAVARPVLVCVLGPVLRDEFAQNSHNEMVAVQRAAAWWMTGDSASIGPVPPATTPCGCWKRTLRFF